MSSKISRLILIIVVLINSYCLGQIKKLKKIDPIVKSLLIPGWGQKSLKQNKRGNAFIYVESAILLVVVASRGYSTYLKRNAIIFAVEHASINKDDKDRQFWVDIGNYNSIYDHNNEHLRNRESIETYPLYSGWNWRWDAKVNRRKFENKRIVSDQMRLISSFGVGATILNHLISAIDASYLKNLNKKSNFTVKQFINNESTIVGYSLVYNF